MSNWYYYDTYGQKQGPISAAELKNLADMGIITSVTRVETEEGQEAAAGDVRGLLAAPLTLDLHSPYSPAGTEPTPEISNYLIWSVITTVCCCMPLGVIALVFSVLSQSASFKGDYRSAAAHSKTSFYCNLFAMILGLLMMVGIYSALLVQTVFQPQETARRIRCSNHEKEIILALHGYHDMYGAFPPLYTVDENGNPLHSWRVLLLPFLAGETLYKQIRLDEPWDSEHNKQFHDHRLDTFHCPSSHYLPGQCFYSAIAGAVLQPAKKAGEIKGTDFSYIEDGTSGTIAFVEVEKSFCWMDPTADVDLEELSKGINAGGRVGSGHPGGALFAMFDGTVRFFSDTVPVNVLKALGDPRDGEAPKVP